jgi:hypothetical protein
MASRLKGTNSDPRVPCHSGLTGEHLQPIRETNSVFFDRFKQQTYARDEALLDLVMGIYNKDTKVLTFAQHKLSIDKHRLSSLNMAM